MPEEYCYLCEKPLPKRQSFYEDHGVKICLECFRTTKRCKKCRFPSQHLKTVEGFGAVCEFCRESFSNYSGSDCYLCAEKIWSGTSFYSDHGKEVCQKCFKDAKSRCFTCRFPHIKEKISSSVGICEFCVEGNINSKTDLKPLLQPLGSFLKKYNHRAASSPAFMWVDWRLILGMQIESGQNPSIKFLDELVRDCYPIFFLKGKYYIIPSIPRQWFMVYMAGQFATADLCKRFGLHHLKGDTPFHEMARGWCHWVSFNTARVLKYKAEAKTLSRYPGIEITGAFSKFVAMAEFRKPQEIIEFAHQNLDQFAKRYL